MAVVTFGGAYAVLAYMAQQAVETYGWLKPGEMLDGLGMAETTPGPLIMVVQFVGFLAAYRSPGMLPPMLAGTLGGLLASWCTFVPCFLFIGLGAPFIENLRNNKPLSGPWPGSPLRSSGDPQSGDLVRAPYLVSESCAFTGVWFLFRRPILSTVDPWAVLLSIAAIIAIFRFKVGMIPTLAACWAAGLLLYLAGVVLMSRYLFPGLRERHPACRHGRRLCSRKFSHDGRYCGSSRPTSNRNSQFGERGRVRPRNGPSWRIPPLPADGQSPRPARTKRTTAFRSRSINLFQARTLRSRSALSRFQEASIRPAASHFGCST